MILLFLLSDSKKEEKDTTPEPVGPLPRQYSSVSSGSLLEETMNFNSSFICLTDA